MFNNPTFSCIHLLFVYLTGKMHITYITPDISICSPSVGVIGDRQFGAVRDKRSKITLHYKAIHNLTYNTVHSITLKTNK